MTVGLLHDGLADAVSRRRDSVALRAGEQTWTWADLDQLAERLGARLAALGAGAGDRVALMTSNRIEFLAAVHAVSRLGAASVLVSPAWRSSEVAAVASLTAPVFAVTDGAGTAIWQDVLGPSRVVDLDESDLTDDASEDAERTTFPARVSVDVDSDAVLVFSSGTTGLPKAVRHTHRSLGVATQHWVTALGLGPDDRFQVATPPSHILGLLNLLAAVRAGAQVRLHARFDLDEVLDCIESDCITLEMAVAPIALALARAPDLESRDLSSLRYIMWGATPVTPSVAEEVTARTGVRWMPAYGASELPVIAANPVEQPEQWRLDSAGLAPDGVELRVADLDTGAALAPGGIGEIQARSPSVMAGYLPEQATAAAFVDGWYRTGDVGWIEEGGWVHLTDRCKEMIKVSGFQVAPAELESVLHGHEAVADCAVFAIPDEGAGEVPVAAVCLEPGATVSADELKAVVADTLATYKQLRDVVFVEEVPRLASGKVLRRTLRDEWAPRLTPAPDGAPT